MRSATAKVVRARVRPGVVRVLVALLGLVATGCGTVCEDASAICGFDTTAQPDDCTGVDECAALCIIEWDSCDVNDAKKGESRCIARCLEQGEGG